MKPRNLFAILFLASLAAAWPTAQPKYMSVDEVRAGMVGSGRTVFDGDRVEDFKVHILGVLRNVNGPRRNVILARLEGGPLASTGVIAGMSGSPVYVDGRLLGAVAFSVGQFSKEPIAGITPIQEMIETAGPQAPRSAVPKAARLGSPATEEQVLAALRRASAWVSRPFADSPADVRLTGVGLVDQQRATQLGVLMRPIDTPLALGGFAGALRESVVEALRDSGFAPMPGGVQGPTSAGRNSAARPEREPTLRPGDAVGVSLVTGDFSMGATGTVTEVDGSQVYAFGHPLYNLGTIEFPMTTAFVHALLPSLNSSMKISTTGETIGTFRQDRATAIGGTLGAGPDLVPFRISLDTERGVARTCTFAVVNDPFLAPLLTFVSMLTTLSSYEHEYGAATFVVRGSVRVRGHGAVVLDNVFAGDSPAIGAAAYVVAPVQVLLGNEFERVDLEGVDLQITTGERPQTSTLERAWIDAVNPKAGTTVPLTLTLRTYRGDAITRTVPIEIPANATGVLSVFVSDGVRLAQWEQREARGSSEARDLAQLMRVLNRTRTNNRLYVRLLRPDEGAVVNGESLSSLPPSVLAVMQSDRNGGSFSPLRSATIGEWEVATGSAVSGSRMLTITLQNK